MYVSWHSYHQILMLIWKDGEGFSILTHKQLGHFSFRNLILFSNVYYKCDFFLRQWSNAIHIWSALWVLMIWCFSTRASGATVLNMQPYVSRRVWVKTSHGNCREGLGMVTFQGLNSFGMMNVSSSCGFPIYWNNIGYLKLWRTVRMNCHMAT